MTKHNIKRHKIEAVKYWINALTQDQFGMEKLKAYNGDELDNMTLKEIDMLLNFIIAAYHVAFKHGVDCFKIKS